MPTRAAKYRAFDALKSQEVVRKLLVFQWATLDPKYVDIRRECASQVNSLADSYANSAVLAELLKVWNSLPKAAVDELMSVIAKWRRQ